MSIAQRELERLNGIIREFLGAFRPARARLAPGFAADSLKDALAALKNVFEDRRIGVAIDLPRTMPLVAIDRAQMEQVFFNLMKNALEAMKDGGSLMIEIKVDDTSVSVMFRDSGAGMSDTTLARLFEPYRTTKKRGTGLGLMIGIKTEKPAREVADRCMEEGVLVLTAKDKLRLLPALNIPFELLRKAIEIIKKVCAE